METKAASPKVETKQLEDGTYEASYAFGLDHNNDGQKSIELGLYARANTAEAAEEALYEIGKMTLPPWLKTLLGIK